MAQASDTLRLRPIDPSGESEWDALAGSTVENGFMQGTAWAEFKRMEGYRTTLLGLFEDDALVGGASLLQYAGPSTGGIILCPEGPVLPAAHAREGLRLIAREAEQLAASTGKLGLRIEPHLPPPVLSIMRNFVRAPVDLTPLNTLIVDVDQPDDVILSRMHSKARYNLRLAVRHGVSVVRSTDLADIKTFYNLFSETTTRGGFFGEPYGFFINMATAMFAADQAALYLAHWHGEVLAAIFVVFYGIRATYLYGASTRRHRDVMAVYPLHWTAIVDARARGCREYDLFAYDPYGHPDHLYAGISRFKTQWGGVRRDSIGAHDCIFYDRLADNITRHLSTAQS